MFNQTNTGGRWRQPLIKIQSLKSNGLLMTEPDWVKQEFVFNFSLSQKSTVSSTVPGQTSVPWTDLIWSDLDPSTFFFSFISSTKTINLKNNNKTKTFSRPGFIKVLKSKMSSQVRENHSFPLWGWVDGGGFEWTVAPSPQLSDEGRGHQPVTLYI